jgi:hypothetical protein
VDYSKIVELIPAEKLDSLSDQLIGFILTTKNDEKMPTSLANTILLHMKNGAMGSKVGLATLLEAALLLEPEKTVGAFGDLQMVKLAEQIVQQMLVKEG